MRHLQNDKHKMSQSLSQLEQSKRAESLGAKEGLNEKEKHLKEKEHRLGVIYGGLKER